MFPKTPCRHPERSSTVVVRTNPFSPAALCCAARVLRIGGPENGLVCRCVPIWNSGPSCCGATVVSFEPADFTLILEPEGLLRVPVMGRTTGMDMSAADDYRRRAEICAALREQLEDPFQQALAAQLAAGWLRLAAEVDRNSRPGSISPDQRRERSSLGGSSLGGSSLGVLSPSDC